MNLRLVLLLALGASLAAALPNRTICSLPIWERSGRAAHAYHATSYFSSEFPLINWKAKYINVYPGSAADMVRGWVLNGGDCDAVIGPSTSTRAIAMSPLVEVMWLDPGATSTELSDKKNHPTFSRVIPTDEVLAKAAGQVYENFGWNATHILCTNEAYGRSVATGVSTAIRENGGSVDLTICLDSTATGDRVADVLDQFYASKTRIIFTVAEGEFLKAFQDECLRRNCSNDFIFFFAEGSCPYWESSHLWPGALCATYLVDQNKLSGFFDSYYNRNLTVERAELTALGWPNTTSLIATDVYAQFAVDATHHAMSALTAYHLNNSYGNVIDFVRNHRSEGATGTIVLDSAGNRAAIDVAVYNTNSTGSWNAIATMRGGRFQYSDTQYNVVTTRPDILFRNTTYTSSDTLPSVEISDDGSSVTVVDHTVLIVGVSVAGVLVLIILVIAVVFLTRAQRDTSAAPKDQTKPFTMAFTDIQSSTNLWNRIPEKMAEAVDTHHALIRKLIKRHNGYEVKTIGDSFMVAFTNTKDAIEFAVGLQYDFYNYDWGHRAIDEVYQQLAEEKMADAEESPIGESVNRVYQSLMGESASALPTPLAGTRGELSSPGVHIPQIPVVTPLGPNSATTGGGNSELEKKAQQDHILAHIADPKAWNGLRVRVGINHGMGEIKFDKVALGYDYYGTVVNTAARVEGVGNGGQVLVTGAAYDDVTKGSHEVPIPEIAIAALGPQPLRGLDEPVPLYQVLPAGLANREFAPLRLDVERDIESESDVTSAPSSPSPHYSGAQEVPDQQFPEPQSAGGEQEASHSGHGGESDRIAPTGSGTPLEPTRVSTKVWVASDTRDSPKSETVPHPVSHSHTTPTQIEEKTSESTDPKHNANDASPALVSETQPPSGPMMPVADLSAEAAHNPLTRDGVRDAFSSDEESGLEEAPEDAPATAVTMPPTSSSPETSGPAKASTTQTHQIWAEMNDQVPSPKSQPSQPSTAPAPSVPVSSQRTAREQAVIANQFEDRHHDASQAHQQPPTTSSHRHAAHTAVRVTHVAARNTDDVEWGKAGGVSEGLYDSSSSEDEMYTYK